jgi:hypothetical protein
MFFFHKFADEAETERLQALFIEIRETYAKGEDALRFACGSLDNKHNRMAALEIAYDSQTGGTF